MTSRSCPFTAVTPVILLKPGDPMPEVGTLVNLVGYGFAGTGTQPAGRDPNGNPPPGTVIDSRRRIGETNIGAFDDVIRIIRAQFRNPQSSPNVVSPRGRAARWWRPNTCELPLI